MIDSLKLPHSMAGCRSVCIEGSINIRTYNDFHVTVENALPWTVENTTSLTQETLIPETRRLKEGAIVLVTYFVKDTNSPAQEKDQTVGVDLIVSIEVMVRLHLYYMYSAFGKRHVIKTKIFTADGQFTETADPVENIADFPMVKGKFNQFKVIFGHHRVSLYANGKLIVDSTLSVDLFRIDRVHSYTRCNTSKIFSDFIRIYSVDVIV